MPRILFEGTEEQIEMLRTLIGFTDNSLPQEMVGYYVDSLWHIQDVQSRYKCSEEEAMAVLESVFNEELMNEDVFEQIHREAEFLGLETNADADD